MKKPIVTILRYTVLASILIFGFWYFTSHFDTYARRANFTPGRIFLLIMLNLCTIACESVRLRMMIRKLGKDIGPILSWHMITLFQAVNHIVLKAGTFSGGYYLSRRYNISFNSYIAFVVTYVVVIVLASGILGFFLSMAYLLAGVRTGPLIPLFFLAVILGSAGMIAAARIRLPLRRLPKPAAHFLESIRTIYSDTGMLALFLGIECLYHLTTALRFMTAVSLFSGHSGLLDSIIVVSVGNFLRIATIVPGGIGIAEVASAWTSGLLGDDAGLAGLSAGLDRLVYILLVMAFGGIGFLSITNRREFHRPSETACNASEL